MSVKIGSAGAIPFFINETDLLAGTAQDLVAPCDGHLDAIQCIVQKDVTTGGNITVNIGTTAVVGLAAVIANGATKGTRVTDTPTLPSATRSFSKGDRISVVPDAAFATAGAVNGNLLFNTGK
jgi:hypothetical protein